MALSDNKKLTELRESRRGVQHIIRAARTDSLNDEFFKRSETDLIEKIRRYLGHLRALRRRKENASDIIEAGQARVAELTNQIKIMENQKAIKELLRLVSKM